jgi:hypothetical protein
VSTTDAVRQSAELARGEASPGQLAASSRYSANGGQLHIYYESPDYENEAVPGTFAALAVIGDGDGPHLVFISGNQVIADLSLPPGILLEIRKALDHSADDAVKAAEYDTDSWQEEVTAGRQAAPLPEPARPAVVPPPPGPVKALPGGHVVHHEYGMTPYGRREIPGVVPAGRDVGDEPEQAGTRDTRELPAVTCSWLRGRGVSEHAWSRLHRDQRSA